MLPIRKNVRRRMQNYVLGQFEKKRKPYEKRIINNMQNLYKVIRKGDVILVEGDAEISRMIKLFTKSSWSHSALYVGDELRKNDPNRGNSLLAKYGNDARHMIVEAISGRGVIAEPLRKYQDYNFRICRPYGISTKDNQAVVADVISNLGKQYDQRNIIDLGLLLLPPVLNPFKKRTIQACLGNCNEFQVICSGMIAKAFQGVGYPILPALCPAGNSSTENDANPYGSKLLMRHYSQIMPRDFDLSPNFDIVKFNMIAVGEFDYKSLWAHADPMTGHAGPGCRS